MRNVSSKVWAKITGPPQGPYDLRRLIGNTGWLFADRALGLGLTLVIGVWLVRYLGPESYGLYSYVLAFVALFSTVATLGIDGLATRDLVNQPEATGETLGTMFGLKLAVGLAAIVATIVSILALRPSEPLIHWLVTITALTMLFRPFDVIEVWFQSQIRARSTVLARNTVLLTFFALKVALILAGAPLVAFVWAGTAEVVMTALSLVLLYVFQRQSFAAWRFSGARAAALLKEGWPLIFGGVSVTIYMRIDQVMIGQMLGVAEVGIYSVATRISELGYFVPMAVMASLAPALIEARKGSRERYERQMQRVFNLMVLLALAITIPGTLLARPVLAFVFGEAFAPAGNILMVHIWATLFVFIGVAQSTWDINEGLTRYGLFRTASGAVINVALNLLLIPLVGAIGAALATLIAQGCTAWLLNLVNPATRPIFFWQARALMLRDLVALVLRRRE